MKRFTGKLPILKSLSTDQIQKWSGEYQVLLKSVIDKEAVTVVAYVEHIRGLNTGIDQRNLAKKIVSRRAMKAGGIGAICSLGGFFCYANHHAWGYVHDLSDPGKNGLGSCLYTHHELVFGFQNPISPEL